jgi:geranylgeranyl diphosphate synthase type I
MYAELKDKIDIELTRFVSDANLQYSLQKNSPILLSAIKDFVLRRGKRVRPILFIMGYQGFSAKTPKGLFRSAVSMELLHDFLLIHDDIIDRSDTRRGKPSMHMVFENYLNKNGYLKTTGQDLAIMAGDIIYAMAVDAFLAIRENPARKELALKKYLEGTVFTGIGELEEVLYETKKLEDVTKDDIYKIYDLKTAYYTFACPLACGALIAGADKKEINRLLRYGIYLGRAFQIKDDILGVFGNEKKIGKSPLTDIQEGKKTILVWYSYNHSDKKVRAQIKSILGKRKVTYSDLSIIKKIMGDSGALEYSKMQIDFFIREAEKIMLASKMKNRYKRALLDYSMNIVI